MMDIHATRGDKSVHVMTIHRAEKDETPLQMVSDAQVKAWMQKEVDYDALMARLEAGDPARAPAPEQLPES